MKDGPRKKTASLQPHARMPAMGLMAAAGVATANLLDQWPLEINLDNGLNGKHFRPWRDIIVVNYGKYGITLLAIFPA